MRWTWDPQKNRANQLAHGLSFETAVPPVKRKRTKKVSPAAELEALRALPDNRINLRDIPEVTDWSGARRGLLYRPIKQQLTLRLDADVVAWFKRRAPGGRGYQTYINRALRQYVEQRQKRTERS